MFPEVAEPSNPPSESSDENPSNYSGSEDPPDEVVTEGRYPARAHRQPDYYGR